MNNFVYDFMGFLLVAMVGYGVIYYKKNRKRWKWARITRALTRHPSDGMPSEWFIDALGRKFPKVKVIDQKVSVRLVDANHYNVGTIWCEAGRMHVDIHYDRISRKVFNSDVVVFLKYIDGKTELSVLSSLLNCGIYCMK